MSSRSTGFGSFFGSRGASKAGGFVTGTVIAS
jgi:hypothetical protein